MTATTTLRATFISESAGYKNSFGWYNKVTGEAGILFSSLEAEGNNSTVTPGLSTADFTVDSADVANIGFFLIPNGGARRENTSAELSGNLRVIQLPNGTWTVAVADADGNVVMGRNGKPETLTGNGASALFTETSKNAGGVDYASSTVGKNQTAATLAGDTADGPTGMLAWEDLAATRRGNGSYSRPGDADYNDAVFSISIVSDPSPLVATNDSGQALEGGVVAGSDATGLLLTNDVGTGLSVTGIRAGDEASTGTAGVVGVATAGLFGALTVNADGGYVYAVNNANGTVNGLQSGQSLTDTFTYTVRDASGATDTATVSIVINGANDAPVITSAASANAQENAAGIAYQGAATDADNAALVFSLTGTDAALFDIDASSGAVRFKATPNFEAPDDSDGDGSYRFTLNVSDGGATATRDIAIAVTDVNEAPTSLTLASGGSVTENSAAGTVVGQMAATDPDSGAALTYALSSNPGGLFAIDASTGEITVAAGAVLDFEGAVSHAVTVKVSDQGGLTRDLTLAIAVTNVNEAPTSLTLASGGSVAENSAADTVVGQMTATDPDAGAVLTYALTDNAGGRFTIGASTGQITVAAGATLDAEGAASHDVTVRVTDQGGLTRDLTLSIVVTNVNEAPDSLSLASGGAVAENSAAGTVVGQMTATDPDAGAVLTYALSSNPGGLFAIDTSTGEITVAAGAVLDFEGAASHAVTVAVSDQGGLTRDLTLSIAVTNIEEAPIGLTLVQQPVFESSPGAVVGTLSAIDPEGGAVRFSVSDERFEVAGNELRLAEGVSLDFETTPSIALVITAIDGTERATAVTFTIAVSNAAEGVAVDGYIAGATVFADADGDGVLDAGEVSTTTDANGNYSLSGGTGSLVLLGGTDISTNTAFTGIMRAPDGASVITPLTTLVVAVAEAGNQTVAAAEAQVLAALGLSATLDLATFDPVSATLSTDPATAAAGAAAITAAIQVQNTLTQAAAVIDGAGASATDATNAVTNALAAQISNAGGGTVDLSSVTAVTALITTAAAEASGTNTATVAAATAGVASVISASNTAADDALAAGTSATQLLTSLAQVSIVAQDSVTTIQTAGSSGDATAAVAGFTGTALDTAVTAAAADVGNVIGANAAQLIDGTANADDLQGFGGDDTINGLAGADTIDGGEGADSINGGGGDDLITGQRGNDVIIGGSEFDTVDYGLETGTQGIIANLGTGTWMSVGAASVRDSYGDTDIVTQIERLRGGDLADSIRGDDLNNTLTGRAGADLLKGEGGEDLFFGGLGNDTMDGTGTVADAQNFLDFDIVGYDESGTQGVFANMSTAAVTVNGVTVGAQSAIDNFGNLDTYIDIEGVRGSAYADIIVGGNAANDSDGESYWGLGGNDTMLGGSGFDELRYDRDSRFASGQNGVTINMSAASATLNGVTLAAGTAIDGFGNTDTFTSMEGIRGSTSSDIVLGSAANDTFRMVGGADTIDGGAGFDTVDYRRDVNTGGTLGIIANLGATAVTVGGVTVNGGQIRDGFGTFDTVINIEQVRGTNVADTVHGSANADTLRGENGDDVMFGASGADSLRGDNGNDSLEGGNGNDTLDGGANNDTMLGGADNDLAFASAGADVFNGGSGTDTLSFNLTNIGSGNLTQTIFGGVVNIQRGGVTLFTIVPGVNPGEYVVNAQGAAASAFGTETVIGVENLNFSFTPAGAGSFLSVQTAINATTDGTGGGFITGTAFGDAIDVAALIPTANATNSVNINAGAGNDTITGHAGQNFITAGLGNDIVDAGAGLDNLSYDFSTIGTGTTITLSSGPGGSVFVNRGGQALLTLTQGVTPGSAIISASGAAVAAYGTTTATGVESLTIGGAGLTSPSINLGLTSTTSGNSSFITGSVFADVIDVQTLIPGADATTTVSVFDGLGNDSVVGHGGTNLFSAGQGNDTYAGGAGQDTLNFDLSAIGSGAATVTSGGGIVNVSRGGVGVMQLTRALDGTITATGLGDGLPAFGVKTISGIEVLSFNAPPNMPTMLNLNTTVTFTPSPPPGTGGVINGSVFSDTIDVSSLAPSATASDQVGINAGAGDDNVTGHAGSNFITADGGNDTLDGAGGSDTYSVGLNSFGTFTSTLTTSVTAGGVWTILLDGNAALQLFKQLDGSVQVTGVGVAASLGSDRLVNIENLNVSASAALPGGSLNLVIAPNIFFVNGNGGSVFGSIFNDDLSALAVFPSASASDMVGLSGGAGNDTLTGHAGGNSLSGEDGDDMIFAGGGFDNMTGGAGNDTFIIGSGSGNYFISDFETASLSEIIDFSGAGAFTDYATMLLSTTNDSFGSAIISWGAGNSLTISNRQIADLSAGDFVF